MKKKKAKKLFTHVGELVIHSWSKGEERERVRLRETPTMWVECREDGRSDVRYRKPKDEKDRCAQRIGGGVTYLTGPSVYVDVDTIREATQEDHLEYFKENIARKKRDVGSATSVCDEIQQRLNLATADLQSAVQRHTEAIAELDAYLILHDLACPW